MEDSAIEIELADTSTWIVSLRGDHDMSTSPELRRALDEIIFRSGTCAVVDLSAATFVDSSVLSELVTAHRRIQEAQGDQLVVVAPPKSAAARLFGMTGAEEVLVTYATRDDAMRACGSSAAASG